MTPFLGYIIVSNAFLVILWVSLMVVFYQVPVACVLLTVFLGLVFALNFHFFTVIRGHQNEVCWSAFIQSYWRAVVKRLMVFRISGGSGSLSVARGS